MSTLLKDRGSVQCDPREAQWWPEFDAPELPDAGCTMQQWVEVCRFYYGSLAEDGDSEMALVCGALTTVWNAIEMHRPRTVQDLISRPHGRCRKIDLASVRVPAAGSRRSVLAAILDVEAERFVSMRTDLATLCAWAILQQAGDVERLGSTTVEDYLIDEAAERAAWEDAGLEDPDLGAAWRVDGFEML